MRDDGVRAMATRGAAVERLWEVCQVPDYRRISPAAHSEMAVTLYGFLMREGRIPDDWFAGQVGEADRHRWRHRHVVATRIAHIRTWTFAANRPDWLKDPDHWQGVTRAVEDKLSDALHERLTERFVDRRTSVLMRRLRENTILETEISKTGEVVVEGHAIGRLDGFRFAPETTTGGNIRRQSAFGAAAQKALASTRSRRAPPGCRRRPTRSSCSPPHGYHSLGRRGSGEAHRRMRQHPAPARPHPAPTTISPGLRSSIVQTQARSVDPHPYRADCLRRCSCWAPPMTSPASRAASPIRSSRRSACSSAPRSPRTSRASTRRRARSCVAHGVRFGAYPSSTCRRLLKPGPRALARRAVGARATAGPTPKGSTRCSVSRRADERRLPPTRRPRRRSIAPAAIGCAANGRCG